MRRMSIFVAPALEISIVAFAGGAGCAKALSTPAAAPAVHRPAST